MTRILMMSQSELAKLGGGKVAYVREMTLERVRELFANVENLPENGTVFGLFAADGSALCLADSRNAVIGHAISDELQVAPLQ